jgi:protein-S-isoprenylcysteine O-methyltransferase Ste14
LLVAWIMCAGYSQVPTFWLLAHPRAERLRARGRPYAVLVPLWLGTIALAFAVTWPWHAVTLYESVAAWIAGAALAVLGFALYPLGHRGFTHEQLVGRAELEHNQEQRLVVSGIRERVRHPVYLAHLLVMAGMAVASGLAVAYGLLAFALLGFAIMLPMEDAELERRFGDPYRAYRARVPALVPRLGSQRSGLKPEEGLNAAPSVRSGEAR